MKEIFPAAFLRRILCRYPAWMPRLWVLISGGLNPAKKGFLVRLGMLGGILAVSHFCVMAGNTHRPGALIPLEFPKDVWGGGR